MSGLAASKPAINSSMAFFGAGSDWSEFSTSSPASAVEAESAKANPSPKRLLKSVIISPPWIAATMAAEAFHAAGFFFCLHVGLDLRLFFDKYLPQICCPLPDS
jgi:hypothetical protein